MRLLHWMYKVEPHKFKSLCPLFWTVVGSLAILPLYCLIRWTVGLFIKIYDTKFGKVLLDIVGYIGKWIYTVAISFMVVIIFCISTSGIINWWFFNIYDKLSKFGAIFFGSICLLFLIITLIIWCADYHYDRKHKRLENLSMEELNQINETHSKSNNGIKKIINPFRIFSYYISAAYHKICPMIIWKRENH